MRRARRNRIDRHGGGIERLALQAVTADGSLVLDANMTAGIAAHGGSVLTGGRAMLTLKVLGGGGTGQARIVTGWDSATRTLALEAPLDGKCLGGAVMST